jgi:carbonic anhydrase/acetyltransferase-like protein (isoleucine patch superfamily)
VYRYSCKLFLGSKTIIHPGVSIIAEAGPIFIGDGNLIEEQCVIANRLYKLERFYKRKKIIF